jgi:Amt family ammonium transporter
MVVINLVPGLHFRASDEAQVVGMDEVEHMEFVADYAFFRRDLEGNCPERTTHDPEQFFSSKNKQVGTDTKVRSVASPDVTTSDSRDHPSTSGDVHRDGRIVRNDDAEKLQARGRGEAPIDEKAGLERVESGRSQRIRGEDFRKMEGVGRGELGVSDNAL